MVGSPSDPYVEFPVDLIVNVHWRKQPEEPPTPVVCGTDTINGSFFVPLAGGGLRSEELLSDGHPGPHSGEWVETRYDVTFLARLAPGPFDSTEPPPHPWYYAFGIVAEMGPLVLSLGDWADGDAALTGSGSFTVPAETTVPTGGEVAAINYTGPWWASIEYPLTSFPIAYTATRTYYCNP